MQDLRTSPDSAAKLEHLAGSNQGTLLSLPLSAGAAAQGESNITAEQPCQVCAGRASVLQAVKCRPSNTFTCD